MRLREELNGRAKAFQADDEVSIPFTRFVGCFAGIRRLLRVRKVFTAAVAQLVERVLGKDEVTSSSLVSSSFGGGGQRLAGGFQPEKK